MSDFLTRLLARTSARAPVLQARTPALFEPLRGAPAASFDADTPARLATPVDARAASASSALTVSTPGAAARPRSQTSRAPGTAPAAAPAPLSAAARPREAARGPKAAQAPQSPGEQLPSPRRRRVSAANPTTPTAAAGEAPGSDGLPATTARGPAPVAPVLGRSIVSPANATAPVRAAARAPGRAAAVAPDGASAAAIAAGAARQAPAQERSARPRIRPRPAGGQDAAAAAPRSMRSAPAAVRGAEPAPPTVHVTIGRLEVRATRESPAARPAAPRRPAPALDLEQYLRSRGDGGR